MSNWFPGGSPESEFVNDKMTDKAQLEECLYHIRGVLGLVGDQETVNIAGELARLIEEQVHDLEKRVGAERRHKLTYRKFALKYQADKNNLREAIEEIKKEAEWLEQLADIRNKGKYVSIINRSNEALEDNHEKQ